MLSRDLNVLHDLYLGRTFAGVFGNFAFREAAVAWLHNRPTQLKAFEVSEAVETKQAR